MLSTHINPIDSVILLQLEPPYKSVEFKLAMIGLSLIDLCGSPARIITLDQIHWLAKQRVRPNDEPITVQFRWFPAQWWAYSYTVEITWEKIERLCKSTMWSHLEKLRTVTIPLSKNLDKIKLHLVQKKEKGLEHFPYKGRFQGFRFRKEDDLMGEMRAVY